MYLSKWNIGLEVQNNAFCAVAIQKKRYGWQLRGWWQVPLQHSLYNQQGLSDPQGLTKILRSWRRLLPKSVSIRFALPECLTLQQRIPYPQQQPTRQELDWYVEASLNTLFPLPAQELSVDYQLNSASGQNQIIITAARKNELALWVTALSEADLTPDVVDIAPAALQVSAHFAAVPRDNLLIHKMNHELLLVSPLSHRFSFERINRIDWPISQFKTAAGERYRLISGQPAESVSVSGDIDPQNLPQNLHYWSPFSAIKRVQPPMPENPSLFAVPCGLALRDAY
jgi:pilus assembly protein HofM